MFLLPLLLLGGGAEVVVGWKWWWGWQQIAKIFHGFGSLDFRMNNVGVCTDVYGWAALKSNDVHTRAWVQKVSEI